MVGVSILVNATFQDLLLSSCINFIWSAYVNCVRFFRLFKLGELCRKTVKNLSILIAG